MSGSMRGRCVALVIGLIAIGVLAEDVLTTKRKVAVQLMKDGKTEEALILLREVAKGADGNYADHLALAKALDKSGRGNDSLSEYHRAQDLLRTAGGGGEERSARQEIEKRLKQLDPMGEKVAAAAQEFEAKLDALEVEAARARSMSAMERIFKLRGRLWQAAGMTERGYCVVPAASNAWVDAIDVVANRTYRVRAAGTWRVLGARGEHVECTAAGTTVRKPNDWGKIGCLVGRVGDKYYSLGEDVAFTPTASGKLQLSSNESNSKDREQNEGSLQVLIAPQN